MIEVSVEFLCAECGEPVALLKPGVCSHFRIWPCRCRKIGAGLKNGSVEVPGRRALMGMEPDAVNRAHLWQERESEGLNTDYSVGPKHVRNLLAVIDRLQGSHGLKESMLPSDIDWIKEHLYPEMTGELARAIDSLRTWVRERQNIPHTTEIQKAMDAQDGRDTAMRLLELLDKIRDKKPRGA